MPCYLIKEPQGGQRLVIGDTQAQALKYVAERTFTLESLTGQEVAELVSSGMKVEDARKPQREIALAQPPEPVPEPPTLFPASDVAEASVTLWHVPGKSEPQPMYNHKKGCSADPWTPISGKGCRCTELEIPLE